MIRRRLLTGLALAGALALPVAAQADSHGGQKDVMAAMKEMVAEMEKSQAGKVDMATLTCKELVGDLEKYAKSDSEAVAAMLGTLSWYAGYVAGEKGMTESSDPQVAQTFKTILDGCAADPDSRIMDLAHK